MQVRNCTISTIINKTKPHSTIWRKRTQQSRTTVLDSISQQCETNSKIILILSCVSIITRTKEARIYFMLIIMEFRLRHMVNWDTFRKEQLYGKRLFVWKIAEDTRCMMWRNEHLRSVIAMMVMMFSIASKRKIKLVLNNKSNLWANLKVQRQVGFQVRSV